jgi:hypothetical protein
MTKRLGFVFAVLMTLSWSPLRTWAVRPPIERSVGPEQGGGNLSTGDDDEPQINRRIPSEPAIEVAPDARRSIQPAVPLRPSTKSGMTAFIESARTLFWRFAKFYPRQSGWQRQPW